MSPDKFFPELRRDPVIGRWIIVSTERTNRPMDYPAAFGSVHETQCPFCPGRESSTPPEITSRRDHGTAPDTPGWRKRVFLSAYPVVSPDDELLRRGEGMFDMMSGFGVHEVIVDCPDHADSLASMSVQSIKELVILWRERFLELKKQDDLRCITLFANRGSAAGASISHSHSQIIATPIMPRRLSEEIAMCYTYFQSKERCVFCDILESDPSAERIVHQNDAFAVITPFASRFPYETWILPKEHNSHFEDIDDDGTEAFAECLQKTLRALKGVLNDPPYSFVLHAAPTHERGMVHYHWHLEVMPRLTHVAGFEWGTGFYINPIPPEAAAAALREYQEF